mmetsp:Transcript_635/g.1565  ORF Transcript_635/g.1565 Transcript_635/m.1565 type:complete len:213 (+) Transcript_635:1055-1693(+)
MSTATLFFFSFLAILTSLSLSSATGLPTKITTRWRWFLFWRCLRHSWAICTAVASLHSPSISTSCMLCNTLPRSGVGVTSTRGVLPAIANTPTVFSGLACVRAPASRLTASAWLWKRLGGKSPLRVHSLLSITTIVASIVTRLALVGLGAPAPVAEPGAAAPAPQFHGAQADSACVLRATCAYKAVGGLDLFVCRLAPRRKLVFAGDAGRRS